MSNKAVSETFGKKLAGYLGYIFVKKLVVYVVVCIIGAGLVFLVHFKTEKDYDAALQQYREISQAEAVLAGAKAIDRHGQNLNPNAYPDDDFLQSRDAKAIRNFSYFGYGAAA